MRFDRRADAPLLLLAPPPRVLSPSGLFEGNDGNWSTFVINIAGDGKGKGQNFRVLPSTSWKTTIIPAANNECSDEACAQRRGIMSYNGHQPTGLELPSDHWTEAGYYSFPYPQWWSNETMSVPFNRSPGAYFGTTWVGLNMASNKSITFSDQYVSNYIGNEFWLGIFGLDIGELKLGASEMTFFNSLASSDTQDMNIPSQSYGFTAGAWYRKTLGNMVFGGYDRTRISELQRTSINMTSTSNNTLLAGVTSIGYRAKQTTGAGGSSLTLSPGSTTPETFLAIIDSTIPYLVLPNKICDRFAERFQLTYNNQLGLYLVNETAHDYNTQQNATVSFKIGQGTTDSGPSTTIELPYAAFDVQLDYPIVDNATKYFPIRRGNNGPYVLGRTFLQEAYIIVDYERTNFTVAPASFPQPLPQENLIPIFNTTYKPPSGKQNPGPDGLSAGTIAGIVIGIVAVFAAIGLVAFFFWKRKRNAKNKYAQGEPSEIDTTVAGGEVKHRRVSELTGSEPPSSPGTTIGGGYYAADIKKYPAIAEMSPDSQPAELEDYFASNQKLPVAELAGDLPYEAVSPLQRPQHSRSPSDTSLTTNIDEVLAGNEKDDAQVHRKGSSRFIEHTNDGPSRAQQVVSPLEEPMPGAVSPEQGNVVLRRPSHSRGPSDTTINSESTAVSELTPEERAGWARNRDSRRPLSE